MEEIKQLVQAIVEGIQEKKGQHISVIDMSKIEGAICRYFVIGQGNSPMQVEAISDSVSEYVRIHAGQKPVAVAGLRNAQWVAMDYTDVMVHIFLPETRAFYNLESLWQDADINEIEDID